MRKFGVDKKPRFTIKFPDGVKESYGTCDPNDDDRADIVEEEGRYYLVKYKQNGKILKDFLFPKTLVTHGFYDHEHTGWMSPQEFVNDGSN
jgi:hypothetical protein